MTEHDLKLRRISNAMKELEKAKTNNWTMITVRNWGDVDTDWCLDNLEGEYICLGYYWYFEKEEDVTIFALRWS